MFSLLPTLTVVRVAAFFLTPIFLLATIVAATAIFGRHILQIGRRLDGPERSQIDGPLIGTTPMFLLATVRFLIALFD